MITEQGTVADIPVRRTHKVYFIRVEDELPADEGWITVDEAKRQNALDRRRHGDYRNRYFIDKDSALGFKQSLGAGGPDVGAPEPEPPPVGATEPGYEPDAELPPEPLPELPELEPADEGPLPELGALEDEDEEELELIVPKRVRLRPAAEALTELTIGGPHRYYEPGDAVRVDGERLEVIGRAPSESGTDPYHYVVRREDGSEHVVSAAFLQPFDQPEPARQGLGALWRREGEEETMDEQWPGGRAELQRQKQFARRMEPPRCPYCGATNIENQICMNCRRKVEAQNEQVDDESTPDGVVQALVDGELDSSTAVDMLIGDGAEPKQEEPENPPTESFAKLVDEACPPTGKAGARAKRAAAKSYSKEREPGAYYGTAHKIAGLIKKKRGGK